MEEKHSNNKSHNKKIFILTCILTVIMLPFLYLTHRAVYFMMDDLWYSTRLYEEVPIRTLKDIWDSQVWHYMNWGGRSINHSILQMILLAGETIADILNIAITLLLALMICIMARHRNLAAFLGAICLMIGCNANWKMSMFWQSGAVNYLYITFPVLFFLYCYLRFIEDDTVEHSTVKEMPGILFWILPLGLVVGWSNENIGPSVWLVTLITIIQRKKTVGRIQPWMILGNIACFIGSVLLIIAPGNFVRDAAIVNEYGWLWRSYLKGYAQSKALLEFLFPTLIILLCLFICSKGILKIKLGKRNIYLLLTALFSWGAMILSPHYPDRATFGTMILLHCAIISIAGTIIRVRKDAGWYLWLGVAALWLRSMYLMNEYLGLSWGWIR